MFGTSAFSATPFAALLGEATPNVTVNLSAVTATGSVGTVTSSQTVSQALSGVTGTGSVGEVAVTIGTGLFLNLINVDAAGSVGSVTPEHSLSLSGVTATGSVGDVIFGYSISEVTGTGSVGNIVTRVDSTLNLIGVTGFGTVNSILIKPHWENIPSTGDTQLVDWQLVTTEDV
jgi:hypothetical protein